MKLNLLAPLFLILTIQACTAPSESNGKIRSAKQGDQQEFYVAVESLDSEEKAGFSDDAEKNADAPGQAPAHKHGKPWQNPSQNPGQNPGQHPSSDLILYWNAVMLEANARDYTFAEKEQNGPTRTSRAFAIVHVAMFDAYNAFFRQYDPYHVDAYAPLGASLEAAVSMAAFKTLTTLWPRQKAFFQTKMAQALRDIPSGGVYREKGLDFGAFVAGKILTLRSDDGSDESVPYVPGEGPFDHVPDPLNPEQGYLDPHWGAVAPFGIGSVEDFVTPDFPDLTSTEYAQAFDEVRRLGGDGKITPTDRSAEQLEIGIFWAYDGAPGLGTPPRLYNQIARKIARQLGNNTYKNARLLALVNLALADAGIKAWFDKYEKRTWRPVIGIRNADLDGNPLTEKDKNWTPYGAPASNLGGNNFTPPFPAYPSGHATFGAAMFRMLANFYNRDDIAFTFTSDELNGVTKDKDGNIRPARPRAFSSFSQAAEENGQSRIYLGIHWSFDKTSGINAGNFVADQIFATLLQPKY